MDDCTECGGTGFTIVDDGSRGPPSTRTCVCVLRRQIRSNIERGMRGLSRADPLEPGASSPLMQKKRVTKDVWVTASVPWFTSHLRHTAARQRVDWGFRVVTDADLMVAWLATAALQGTEILDADARSKAAPVSLTKLTLVDISEPPELLVVRLGVKAARNSAMPEVLYETLTIRAHAGKPTWLWDQPDAPFDQSHLSYSRLAEEMLGGWDRVREGDALDLAPPQKAPRRAARPSGKVGASDAAAGTVPTGASVRDMLLGSSGGRR